MFVDSKARRSGTGKRIQHHAARRQEYSISGMQTATGF
jgi:hypothetical protein